MYDINITSLQKSYLFKIAEDSNKTTITRFSALFDCSKANSKSILDRMVKIGLLYKENKSYLFTILGQNVADDLIQNREKLKQVVQSLFNLTDDKAKNYATDIICQGMKDFTQDAIKNYKYFNHKYEIDDKISYTHLEKLLGYGSYNLCFCIYKLASDKISNGNEFSMANMGFNKKAMIVIDDNSHIVLDSKPIKRSIDGYIKKSIVMNVSYRDKDADKVLISSDGKINIPLKLLSQWYFIDKNIIQSAVYLNTHSKIGFIEHNKKCLFVFTINLYNII